MIFWLQSIELLKGVHWIRNFFFVPTKMMPRKLSKDYNLRRNSIFGQSIAAANNLVVRVTSKNEITKKPLAKPGVCLTNMV